MVSDSTSSSSSMEFLLLEEVQFLEVKDDALLQWELVDVFEKEDDGESIGNGFGSRDSPISSPGGVPIESIRYHPDADVEDHDHRDVDQDDDDDEGDANRNHQFADDVDGESHGHHRFDYGNGGGIQVDGEDEDEDDGDDGYDLDDELVPWNVSNKFERQRMRKLGKRVFSKMNNSKRSPYLFVRPGCVRGKHGLGLKHNY